VFARIDRTTTAHSSPITTGGNGSIAACPSAHPDPFTFPGLSRALFYTTGVAATVATNTAAAEDFTVPPGETWDLNSVTLYAFQTGQTSATVPSHPDQPLDGPAL